jgi:hypothetical protein
MKRIVGAGPVLLGAAILGLGLGAFAPAVQAAPLQEQTGRNVVQVEYYMRDGHRFWRDPPHHRAPPPRHDDHHH